ncbi:MAG: CarD family transcriptional regulator [Eubacteriales bacterium]|nr:CarD family transcriptional regulator [Eubacteriales bacterium]
MFDVGDLVCYPMHGIGVVESISEQKVLGQSAQYYQLRFIMGRMTAMIPVDTAESVGLRALIDKDTCDEVVGLLESDEYATESDNWNQRYRENLDKLRGGDVFVVAKVVKCLMRRDRQKGLSAGERKMYLTARQVLVAELSAASGRDESEFLSLVGG